MNLNEYRGRAFLIFLLAMAVLSLEVALTRVFSFIMFHHFTYLVISIAMLGFGAAGTYLSVKKPKEDDDSNEFIAKQSGLFGLGTLAAIIIIPRIHFYPLDMYFYNDYSNLLSLLIIILLTGIPFFFAGVCIAYIVSTAAKKINHVYFADLAGAAGGCLVILFLINYIGAIAACIVTSAMALVVAFLSTKHKKIFYLSTSVVVLLLSYWVYEKNPLPLYVPRHKQMYGKEQLIESIKWHVTTRLDITRPVDVYYSFGGALSRKYDGPAQKVRVIYQDATALTGMIEPAETVQQTTSLDYYLQGAPYKIKPKADSLVIGCGGGADLMIALYNNVNKVVGVDINPQTIKLLHEYSDFTHGAFEGDNVELVAAEGRHFLSRDQRKFDVIQLSGVDTSAALASGAYALSENFIYTLEAFDQYLNHLKPDGIVNFSRPPGWQTQKIITMWMETFEKRKVQEPYKHIMILQGNGQHRIKVGESWMAEEGPWAQTIVKQSPFTREEVKLLTDWTEQLGFEVVYDPYTFRNNKEEQLIIADRQKRRLLIDQCQNNIAPCSDDSPFYFQYYRWSNMLPKAESNVHPPMALIILLGSLVMVTILSGIFIIYPLRGHGQLAKAGGRAGIFVYFASLGLGFILLEVVLLQKLTVFLGGPAYSMAITLFTILLTAGIGSFVCRNWSTKPMKLLAIVIPILAVTVLGELALMGYAIPRLMYLSHFMRAVVTTLMIAPLGLLMGMPFPTGLRYLDRFRPELIPWAWGINACATVMGSVLCILISSVAGFTLALLIGTGVYLIGWIIFAITQRQYSLQGQR